MYLFKMSPEKYFQIFKIEAIMIVEERIRNKLKFDGCSSVWNNQVRNCSKYFNDFMKA